MNPASANIVLLRRKKNVCRSNSPVLYPKLSAVKFYHDNDYRVRAYNLTPTKTLTCGNIADHLLVSDDNELHRIVTE